MSAFMYSWKCVSSAPFGLPGRAGGVDDDGGVLGEAVGELRLGLITGEQLLERPPGRRLRRPGMLTTNTVGTPASAVPFVASSATAANVIMALALELARWKATSGAFSSTFIGTTTPPALRMPK